jgi:biotin operon repressor
MPHKVTASGFAIVPYALMDALQNPATWAVYAVVHRHGFGSDQGCWTSLETIHRETGVSRKVVQRSLCWLKENGWLIGKPRPGRTTVYRVLTEPHLENDLGRKRPRSKTTRVENDLPPRSKTTWVPRSKTTYEQEPKNKNPLTRTPIKGGKSEKDQFTTKRLPSHAVPADLIDCSDLIAEFWGCKKGTRSERVFNRICNKLKQWTPEQRQDALERAIAAGWGDVFEPRPQAAHSASQGRDRVWTSEEWAALDNVNLF